MENLSPFVSVIVPIYNVEGYLSECVESLLDQDISLEIILVDDGSTDSSGIIADMYANRNSRINVIHQVNRGLSETRNTGLRAAVGKYVVFIDSDDYIEKDALKTMSWNAEKCNADMVMGQIAYFYPNGAIFEPLSQIIKDNGDKCFRGKEWFVKMLSSGLYYMMVCNYVYRREWLVRESLSFDPVLHEDELWTPVALSRAERILVVDTPFYYYRQRPGSIMNTLLPAKRVNALMFITDKLSRYSNHFTLVESSAFKSWLWVDICRLYSYTFADLLRIRDSSFVLPEHYMDTIPKIYRQLDEHTRHVIRIHYKSARQSIRVYTRWRDSLAIQGQYDPEYQCLILLYNVPERIVIPSNAIPEQAFITSDRKYRHEAHSVVFYLPDLHQHIDEDLEKPDGQRWIALFNTEDERENFMQDYELYSLFDEAIVTGTSNTLTNIC